MSGRTVAIALSTFAFAMTGLTGLTGMLAVTAQPAHALPCEGQNPDPSGGAEPSDYYDGYARTAADEGKAITPEEALARGADWLQAQGGSPEGKLWYCQSDSYPDRHNAKYRTDCSGFVSMAWHVDRAKAGIGYTTLSISAVSEPIDWSDLQPGDALNNSGHIELVEKVTDDQIVTMGYGHTPPERETYTWIAAQMQYTPIRYDKMRGITDEMVREEIEQQVPKPEPSIQPPGGETLVGLPTIFYANIRNPWRETVDMGPGDSIRVRLRATATGFFWDFDGDDRTDRETKDEGRPYPLPTITHPYESTGEYEPSVDIRWSEYAYNIVGDGQGWQRIEGSHTDDGPTTTLTVLQSLTRLGG